jgi:hypothetical protein
MLGDMHLFYSAFPLVAINKPFVSRPGIAVLRPPMLAASTVVPDKAAILQGACTANLIAKSVALGGNLNCVGN